MATRSHALEDLLALLEKRNRRLSRLAELLEQLHLCKTAAQAVELGALALQEMFPGSTGEVSVVKEGQDALPTVAAWPRPPSRRRRPTPMPGTIPAAIKHAATLRNTLPIPVGQGRHGYIQISDPGPHFDDSTPETGDRQLLATVARNMALALSNLRLRERLGEEAIRDPLTGLVGRRYLGEWLRGEVARARQHRRALGIIMVDVDHFRRVNTDHGYAAGDAVLCQVALQLRAAARPGELACRMRGDEFVLVLPEVSLPDTTQRASNLVVAVRDQRMTQDGTALSRVTVSAGVCWYPKHGDTVAELVERAGVALRQAQALGSNRVAVWSGAGG